MTIADGILYYGNEDFNTIFYLLLNNFIQGSGIEIGAIHHPTIVPDGVTVTYMDLFNEEEMESIAVEKSKYGFVHVDIKGNANIMEGVNDTSQDFLILNNVFEHLRNPLLFLKNAARVLKKEGILYLVIPDLRYCPGGEKERPETTFEHLFEDLEAGLDTNDEPHYRESLIYSGVSEPEKLEDLIERSKKNEIHFHLWTHEGFIDMITRFKKEIEDSFELVVSANLGAAIVSILKKV